MEKRTVNIPVKIVIDDDKSHKECIHLTVGNSTVDVDTKPSGNRRWCREYSPYGECYSYTAGSGRTLQEDLEEIIESMLKSFQ